MVRAIVRNVVVEVMVDPVQLGILWSTNTTPSLAKQGGLVFVLLTQPEKFQYVF
jgi:hypothetical protein